MMPSRPAGIPNFPVSAENRRSHASAVATAPPMQ